MSTAVAIHQVQPAPAVPTRMTTSDVLEQVGYIQGVMRAVMKKDEHYGVIPGTGDKPSLLKPGAEKLLMTFRLGAFPEVETVELGNGHREYRVTCALRSLVTKVDVGVGVGSASTHETKWRYRNENTGKDVPQSYWETRDASLLGGPDYTARKVKTQDGKQAWKIFHRVEHDNPADCYNTCLKMAKKRALVDAVLTSLAASDIFTQDVEEMEHGASADGDGAGDSNGDVPGSDWRPVRPRAGDNKGRRFDPPKHQDAEVQETTGIIEEITHKDGKNDKTGKSWTKYGVKVDGNWYGTFDVDLGEGILGRENYKVTVKWVADGKYRTLKGYTFPEPREPGQEG